MNMDREAKEYYEVIIQAKDMGGQLGGLAGTTTVNITLSDVNDNPPRFPQSEYLPSQSTDVRPERWPTREVRKVSVRSSSRSGFHGFLSYI